MDNNIIPLTEGTDYSLTEDSIIITILSDYVKTLTGAENTLSVKFINYSDRIIKFTFSNSSSGGSHSTSYTIPSTGIFIIL